MFKFNKKHTYSEDMFADTRMSFGDHLEDLRTHLWRAIKGFVIIMLGVFVFDGIGLLTETRFGIGRPMLDFIIAPVSEQLEEFQENKNDKLLRELPTNQRLQAANRPQYVRMSEIVNAPKGENPLQSPLPFDGQPISYGDLIGRAQYAFAAAAEAFQERNWTDLKTLADDLKSTAERFDNASKIPDEAKDELAEWANKLLEKSQSLVDAADNRRAARSVGALRDIQDLLGNKGLGTRYMRVEEPLVLSIQLSRATGWTQGRFTLSTLSIMEAFMAYFKVALMCGLVLGSPWIFIQIWSFIAVGLYPHEKRLVNVYLPFSLALFLIGVLVCQFLVIPKAVGALLWFNQWLDMEPGLRFNEWLSFAIMMPLVFGISFQLPLVMMFLERIGVTTVPMYLGYWKIAFLLIHILAAFLMPTPDIISMELLAIPLFGLYGLGILLCKLNPGSTEEEETPSPEQMVEV